MHAYPNDQGTSAPGPATPARPPARAAFFGLDNTLIPGSSLFHLARGLHQRDLFRTIEMVRIAWQQLLYRALGPDGLEGSKDVALEFVQGRERGELEQLAREIAEERIVPHVYPTMASLIDRHRRDGLLTFVATAAPVELARIVAAGLGMTGGLGTSAEVDTTDRYSGRLTGSVLHGPAKAEAVAAHAVAVGIDLAASVAYSDSINDLPLLELVGRAEVVNPDRRLRRVADRRGWPMHEPTDAVVRPRPPAAPVPHRVAALQLMSPVTDVGPASARSRNHHFTTDDPGALVEELVGSGRFRRDTRMGGLFHRGRISLREVAPTDSLHITLGDDNLVRAHVDRRSPLASVQPDDGVRYSLPRVAAHNVTGMAGDLARLLPFGRRRRTGWTPDSDDDGDGDSTSGGERAAG